ncbi:hypothetical protein QRD02_06480 [Aequorivita sp. SDUM287046]|uniref:Beta-lactamase-inhibitor-like PepSY-like domain-containing protein n=1 Tax=Aequorivita aurantiaca TaxID=3053356 RepID=A0ABT8DFA1_9FLAO|nr:hypothetical protein [Aequorivita aurantiaca]MDN3724022.1 hypothetical protein [Aequorivita aurantiaca]
MRKIYTLLLFLLFSAVLPAQNVKNNTQFIPQSEVPLPVLERQKSVFPTNFVSEWQVQKINEMQDAPNLRYIAKFEEDGRPGFSASYFPDGLLLYHSEFIPGEIIPAPVRLKIEENYKDFTIHNSEFISLYYPQREIYLVKLMDDMQMQYVFYDTNGNEIDKNNLPVELLFLLR